MAAAVPPQRVAAVVERERGRRGGGGGGVGGRGVGVAGVEGGWGGGVVVAVLLVVAPAAAAAAAVLEGAHEAGAALPQRVEHRAQHRDDIFPSLFSLLFFCGNGISCASNYSDFFARHYFWFSQATLLFHRNYVSVDFSSHE